MKNYQLLLPSLFKEWANEDALNMEQLMQAGSDRRYFRIFGATKSAIGTYNADLKENTAFIRFSQHFFKKGLPARIGCLKNKKNKKARLCLQT